MGDITLTQDVAENQTDHGTDSGKSSKQYVTFLVGRRSYGVDIVQVREIKQWSQTTTLPNQPEYTRGVLNLRGTIVPVFDLRARFGGGLSEATENHVVVIVLIEEQTVGILVDAVSDIITVADESVKPVPGQSFQDEGHALSGLVSSESDMVALLDLEHLFPRAEESAA